MRIEVIVAVSQDIDYGMVLMLTKLAIVGHTNRLEAHFDELEKGVRNLTLGLFTQIPEKFQRFRYTQTWFERFDEILEAGESLEGLDKESEIPEWAQRWTRSKDKEWRAPAVDTYLLAKPFHTGTFLQLADKGHRERWRRDVLPRIPELRNGSVRKWGLLSLRLSPQYPKSKRNARKLNLNRQTPTGTTLEFGDVRFYPRILTSSKPPFLMRDKW